jgi:hypothetical protein
MDSEPLRFIGAFLAACLVLAIAWAIEGLNLQWRPSKPRWQFSLGALAALVAVLAGIMTLVATYLKK